MNEMMTFPNIWEEFEKLYGFNDVEEIYTNNSRLIPSFRVKQWLDHLSSAQTKKGEWIRTYRDGFGNLIGHCNKCGRRYPVDNFCPNCGTDMRTEEEHPMKKFMYGQDIGNFKDRSL